MCDPIALGVAGGVIGIGSSILEHQAQAEKSKANREAANEAAKNSMNLLNLRQRQEREASKQTIYQMDLEARRADAEQRVAAGESGVAGASITALIRDVERQRLLAKQAAEKNQSALEAQLSVQGDAVAAQRKQRIDAVPMPSTAGLLLRIGGHAVGAGGDIAKNMPESVPKAPRAPVRIWTGDNAFATDSKARASREAEFEAWKRGR